MNPKISVLLPVFNAEKYLSEAIKSILLQSYRNFEVIIINDGSQDNSLNIIKRFSDKRIRIIDHPTNLGLIYSLNEGIAESKGEFIARMDADDISKKKRLENQLKIFQNHTSVGICAGYTQNHTRLNVYKNLVLHSDEIKIRLIFDNIIAHPTVMFRKSIFPAQTTVYNAQDIHAEDYGLWINYLFKTDFYLIPENIVFYQKHNEQISRIFHTQQTQSVKNIHSRFFLSIGMALTDEELNIHEKLFSFNYDYHHSFLEKSEKWLIKCRDYFMEHSLFNPVCIRRTFGWIWFDLCNDFSSKGIYTKDIYFSSRLFYKGIISLPYYMKWKAKNFKNKLKKWW